MTGEEVFQILTAPMTHGAEMDDGWMHLEFSSHIPPHASAPRCWVCGIAEDRFGSGCWNIPRSLHLLTWAHWLRPDLQDLLQLHVLPSRFRACKFHHYILIITIEICTIYTCILYIYIIYIYIYLYLFIYLLYILNRFQSFPGFLSQLHDSVVKHICSKRLSQ